MRELSMRVNKSVNSGKYLVSALWIFSIIHTFSAFGFVALCSDSFPTIIVDSLDRSVTISSQPLRIISLSPVITETLFAIGASGEIAAVTRWCDEPAAALNLPRIGDLAVDLEALISLQPDLVITMKGLRQGVWQKLDLLSIPVLVVDMGDIGQTSKSIAILGKATGHAGRAEEVARSIQEAIDRVRTDREKQSFQSLRVYVEIWGSPPMTAGSDTFMNRVVSLAGGDNIFQDVNRSFFAPSMEEVIVRDPEVILICYPENGEELIEGRPGFNYVSAVKRGRVIRVPVNLYVRTGPRVGQAVRDLFDRLSRISGDAK
ncbi:MAG: hypothetical protein CVV64_03740 [Candidatus Wallbacteria bacterium HGW-Wallbacteria-1]|jgi:iron complex transport system substrate-binding protein|uniref:Fe/B12 periplasmic-binding domain-containing protein n=1 Tax=Candidatus Wallbacteria bacterium HGW-Wallbacteria-1 TaxID=2013854 RepID=A0A2N1PU05_9BACT|nr:MAG: hypothetical protein CVV64_03740 [Candidatus Wallbacteria bacterium HGW-Wallbacteria-1]